MGYTGFAKLQTKTLVFFLDKEIRLVSSVFINTKSAAHYGPRTDSSETLDGVPKHEERIQYTRI
jgi:hypothetical protein